MKPLFTHLLGACMLFSFFSQPATASEPAGSAYDFTFQKLMGGEALPLAQFKGKVMLVVNTASECGFTGQYDGLQALHERYVAEGLVVIGVPSNDFGAQESGSSEQIAEFCKLNYGVTFPMAAKEVVSGDKAHPFYRWARRTLGFGTGPKWNFHKYLVNRQGMVIDHFNSTTTPQSESIVKAIEAALAEPA